jgi:hypothetical protein
MHTADPWESNSFGVQIAVGKLKMYIPSTDDILSGIRIDPCREFYIMPEICKLLNSVWYKKN